MNHLLLVYLIHCVGWRLSKIDVVHFALVEFANVFFVDGRNFEVVLNENSAGESDRAAFSNRLETFEIVGYFFVNQIRPATFQCKNPLKQTDRNRNCSFFINLVAICTIILVRWSPVE